MHLHVHSNYSFLAGTLSIERLLNYAQRYNCEWLALTDTNNVSGIAEFYVQCKKAGIKPIVGAEVRMGHCTAVLLAKNWDGYERICEIVTSVAALAPPARTTNEDDSDDIINEEDETPSAAEEQYLALVDILFTLLNSDIITLSSHVRLMETLSTMQDGLPLYVELSKAEESRWGELCKLAKDCKIPTVATNNVYFGEPGGWKLHSLLRTISTNTDVDTVKSSELAHPSRYFASEYEFKAWFTDLPEALDSRRVIAAQCNVEFDMETSKFTSYQGEKGLNNKELLRVQAETGFAFRYPGATKEHRQRMEKELSIIEKLGFVDYFLVTQDMVQYAQHRNYPYIGRGSGANSIVAYCLEITNVDPIELDLFFERFLNPERRSPPDFDVDFSWRHRDDVIDYLLKKYGEDRTAMLCTITTFKPRGALRAAGKAMGISEAEIKEFSASIPGYGSLKDFMAERDAISKRSDAFKDPLIRRWWELAVKILEFPNHYSIHSGGVILAPEPITRYAATQVAPKGVRILQQDMYSAEDWSLEKLDVLSTRGLGTYLDTITAVQHKTGRFPEVVYDYKTACRDSKARHIMREGETIGCFYVESPAMRQLLKKLRADSFEMLTAASSVIRPGVAQSGMMQAFIERFHDASKIDVPHPKMAEILKTTFGVMVYQEDVIKVAHYIARMSLGEADLLRRAMSGKMRSRDAMRLLQDSFMRGCRKEGIGDAAAKEIWRQMESFAGYSFCKAHSASYAVLSFQQAWLKSYYPAYFMCSVLNNQGGYYRPEVYIQEAKRLGIRLLLPNVNRSQYLHLCPGDGVIQLGFLHIKSLSLKSSESIIAERERDGVYVDFVDFIGRSDATYEDILTLIRCGACDCFGEARPRLAVALGRFYKHLRAKNKDKELPLNVSLRDETIEEHIDALGDYSAQDKAIAEFETFNYTVSCHILDVFGSFLNGTLKCSELREHVGKRVSVGGWMIAAKITRTKKGERMMFANLDDSEGHVDVVFFPRAYAKYALYLRSAGPFRVTGRVAEEYGVISLVAETMEMYSDKSRVSRKDARRALV
jgi:DNA-directed DNA polymerase III PolC